ncbi:MAG: rhodanese-like domain-containing protein [Balneolaceae bacterium]|nr:rhodanese-like domain-containing protein [Balneolaceae bacterium]MBO6547752.1 rhodanese-like domain-containing protein [Balneolaceae bacterium]MBO6648263.1 rhodanese-like domain-containing protein [Balneolaceae bacterium]
MKKLVLLLLLILPISCSQKEPSTQETTQAQSVSSEYEDITTSEFNAEYSSTDPNVVILDVRTDREFEAGYIPNAFQLDFMSPDFKTEVAKLDTSKTYVVYCQSGRRSSAASKIMTQELGFKDVKNLDGGYSTWVKSE